MNKSKLNLIVDLLHLHRGEAPDSYNSVAPLYDDFVKVWDHHIAAPALKYYNQLIAEQVKPGMRVLDAGAGTGERTLALLQYSQPAEIIALDASEAMLKIAESKVQDQRVKFMVGDLNQLPFPDNYFDVVSCTWAIEIMLDPKVAVQEFIRVIKPDGIVLYAFCSLPNGTVGKVIDYVLNKITAKDSPLTHLLTEAERPFHKCDRSSLKQFSGGLTTVATVAKCCAITAQALPGTLDIAEGELKELKSYVKY